MVYNHAQRDRRFAVSGLAPCSWTPPFFLCRFLRYRVLNILRLFRLFQLFNTPTIDLPFLSFYSPNPYRPSLVASNTPSDAPEPLFTSVLCGRSHQHRCRQILTFGEEILASWNSAPVPAPAPFLPTTLSPLATTGYEASYWSMVCRHGMRNGCAWQWGHCFSFFLVGMLSRYCSACFDG